MNKLLKVLAASALVATVLVGCGPKEPAAEEAKIAKAGLGVVSSFNKESGQVNSTFVALGLDKDGKIASIDLDVAQSTPGGAEKELDKTKEERGADYGMKGASAAAGKIEGGAEWDAQAKAFEDFCKGKTPAEVAAVETMDYHGGKAPKEGTDLAAGCTITIDDFLAAVDKAAKNAVEVKADSVVLGRTMSNNADSKQLNTTLAVLALDADKKVVNAKIDVAQIFDGRTETKGEIKEGYGMKDASAKAGKIEGGAEWYEQAAAFEKFCVGKTVEEIAKVETMDYHGGKAPKEGTDLAAGCTITIDAFLEAIAKAK